MTCANIRQLDSFAQLPVPVEQRGTVSLFVECPTFERFSNVSQLPLIPFERFAPVSQRLWSLSSVLLLSRKDPVPSERFVSYSQRLSSLHSDRLQFSSASSFEQFAPASQTLWSLSNCLLLFFSGGFTGPFRAACSSLSKVLVPCERLARVSKCSGPFRAVWPVLKRSSPFRALRSVS